MAKAKLGRDVVSTLGPRIKAPLKSQADQVIPEVFTCHLAVMYILERETLAEYPSLHGYVTENWLSDNLFVLQALHL